MARLHHRRPVMMPFMFVFEHASGGPHEQDRQSNLSKHGSSFGAATALLHRFNDRLLSIYVVTRPRRSTDEPDRDPSQKETPAGYGSVRSQHTASLGGKGADPAGPRSSKKAQNPFVGF